MKYLHILLLFIAFNANAQSEVFYIDFPIEYTNEEAIANRSFYVDSVIDGRKGVYKKLGTVMKGAFKKEIEADFSSPIAPLIKKYFDNIYPREPKHSPVIIEINKIFIDEKVGYNREIGKAEVELIFYVKNKDGNLYEVFSKLAKVEEDKMDATKSHPERIKKAIGEILNKYNDFCNQVEKPVSKEGSLSSSSTSNNLANHANDKIVYEKKDRKLLILDTLNRKAGIYKDFYEFQSNNPSVEFGNINLDTTKRKIKLRTFEAKRVKEEYFGFSFDGKIYLNSNNYQNMSGNYYVKVISEGPYFIVSDDYLSAKEMNRNAAIGGIAVGGGLIGGALGAIAMHSMLAKDIICLDIQSGLYIPVNEKNILNLLETDIELTKAFNSYMTPEVRYNTKNYFIFLNEFNKKHKAELLKTK